MGWNQVIGMFWLTSMLFSNLATLPEVQSVVLPREITC